MNANSDIVSEQFPYQRTLLNLFEKPAPEVVGDLISRLHRHLNQFMFIHVH